LHRHLVAVEQEGNFAMGKIGLTTMTAVIMPTPMGSAEKRNGSCDHARRRARLWRGGGCAEDRHRWSRC
jgi:hypothetical protein